MTTDSQTPLLPDEVRYQLLTEGTNDIIYSLDRDGKLLYISPQIEQYGFVSSDLVSTHFLEHVVAEDRDWLAQDFVDTMGGSGEKLVVFRIRAPNGDVIWLEDYGRVQRHSAGEAVGSIGVLRDVTARRQAELQLESERDELHRLESIITRGPAIIFLWRLAEDFPVEYVSDNVSLLGYSPEEFTSGSVSWVGITHPDEVPRLEDEVQEFLRTGQDDFAQTYRIQAKSGEYRWIDDWNHVIRNDDGEITHIQGIVLDVTSRKEAELALNRSRLTLEEAQRMANIGSWVFYPQDRRVVWSDQLYRLHGLDKDSFEATYETVESLIYPKDRDSVQGLFYECVDNDVPFEAEYRVIRSDGEIREVLTRGQHFPAGIEDDDRWVGTTLDVTELRRLERRILEVARDEQQRLGQDLHDTLGQELAGLAFLAKAIENKLTKECSTATSDARQLSLLATRSVSHARRISHGLAPVDVSSEGLAHELNTLAIGTRDLYGVVCQCTAEEPALVHDNSVATHLYHIAREAVSNATRHANAGYIGIDLATHGDQGTLTVTDDGTWKRKDGSSISDGMGLRIMKSRAAIIGATVSVSHGKGTGTTVQCVFDNAKS